MHPVQSFPVAAFFPPQGCCHQGRYSISDVVQEALGRQQLGERASQPASRCLFPGKNWRSRHFCQLQWRRSGFRALLCPRDSEDTNPSLWPMPCPHGQFPMALPKASVHQRRELPYFFISISQTTHAKKIGQTDLSVTCLTFLFWNTHRSTFPFSPQWENLAKL